MRCSGREWPGRLSDAGPGTGPITWLVRINAQVELQDVYGRTQVFFSLSLGLSGLQLE